MSEVFDALGNRPEYYNSLMNLIESADKENDTVRMETGYFRLGSALTTGDRNFEKADSLLNKCLKISLIKKDSSLYFTFSGKYWMELLSGKKI